MPQTTILTSLPACISVVLSTTDMDSGHKEDRWMGVENVAIDQERLRRPLHQDTRDQTSESKARFFLRNISWHIFSPSREFYG